MYKAVNIVIDDLNAKQYSIMSDILTFHKLGYKYHVIQSGRKAGKSWLLSRLAMFFCDKPEQNVAVICAFSLQNNSIYNNLLNTSRF